MAAGPDRGDDASGSGMVWAVIGTVLSGVLVWGGVGYLIDRWVGTTNVFLPIGLIVGFAAAMYLVIVRYGRDQRG